MRVRPRWPARHSKTQYVLVALVPALIITLSVSGFVWASTEVTVIEDGRSHSIDTHAADVSQVLAEADIKLSDSDVVTPGRNTPLEKGMTIVVRHAVPVVLQLGEERVNLDVVGNTVADALVAVGIDPAASPDVTPAITEHLTEGMSISIPDVFVRVEQEEVPIRPGVNEEEDPTLELGRRRLVRRGVPGTALRVYRVLVAGGVESTRVLSVETVMKQPVNAVMAVGTAGKRLNLASRKLRFRIPPAPSGGTSMRVLATGYSAEQPDLNATTATGVLALRGVMAVDPSVIPLGTRAFIPGYGYAVAADTGGSIHGTRIDLCFDSVAEANAWGRKTVTIIILPQ